ncbi:MAG: hypothetical protein EON88_13040 [Brevundimonas sp.]|nr:MAG: hypothetical protein EON88_13040 [Brevundimonas sp.]
MSGKPWFRRWVWLPISWQGCLFYVLIAPICLALGLIAASARDRHDEPLATISTTVFFLALVAVSALMFAKSK